MPALEISPTDNNLTQTFHPFPRLPLELQLHVLKLAAYTRISRLRRHNIEDYTYHYSEVPICWVGTARDGTDGYASQLLSPYTPTKIYVANKLLRALKWEARFGALMAASRMCRIAALEVWREKVQMHDTYRYSVWTGWTDEAVEGFKRRAREMKERLLKVLGELLEMVGEVHGPENEIAVA